MLLLHGVTYDTWNRRVTALLQSGGIDGVFQDVDCSRRRLDAGDLNGCITDPPREVESAEVAWSAWDPHNLKRRTELLYPHVLHARTPYQFTLSLPGPTIQPKIEYLSRNVQPVSLMSPLVSTVYHWIRSWGVTDLSPSLVLLLVMNFFRVSRHCSTCLTVSV